MVISNIFSGSAQTVNISAGTPRPTSDVIEIQIINATSRNVVRSRGGVFGSSGCMNSNEPSVTTATNSAKGILKANPYVRRCGFINEIQYHNRIPTYGFLNTIGNRLKNTITKTTPRMSPSSLDVAASYGPQSYLGFGESFRACRCGALMEHPIGVRRLKSVKKRLMKSVKGGNHAERQIDPG